MIALLSVSDKQGLPDFARGLRELGFRLVSTGGTARLLKEAGLVVEEVSDLTGFPEIMDGRVKTLHPVIAGGLLARRDLPTDVQAMQTHGLADIALVVVNLYPFEKTLSDGDSTHDEIIENIDIGGPTMLRAAAKNYRHITVVVDPGDYGSVLQALEKGGDLSPLRQRLAARAFAHTARYDAIIADWFAGFAPGEFPVARPLHLQRVHELRYGENPHQRAALYQTADRSALAGLALLQGKELSYNNIVDASAALELVEEFAEPACAIIKHTNPAGCAVAYDLLTSFENALACDPISAFGGIVALNRPVDEVMARRMSEIFFEVIIAPSFTSKAREVLGEKKQLRLLEGTADEPKGMMIKTVRLGVLVQEEDPLITLQSADLEIATQAQPGPEQVEELLFAWRVCKHTKSNAIVLASQKRAFGVGAGQMSRVDAVRLAAARSRFPTAGSVLASDAFFPFRDGIDEAAKIGVKAIIQPGGSRRDKEVIEACDEYGIAMVFAGTRHFRH